MSGYPNASFNNYKDNPFNSGQGRGRGYSSRTGGASEYNDAFTTRGSSSYYRGGGRGGGRGASKGGYQHGGRGQDSTSRRYSTTQNQPAPHDPYSWSPNPLAGADSSNWHQGGSGSSSGYFHSRGGRGRGGRGGRGRGRGKDFGQTMDVQQGHTFDQGRGGRGRGSWNNKPFQQQNYSSFKTEPSVRGRGRGGSYHHPSDNNFKFSKQKNQTPCSFFLSGNCKYGDTCKFEHYCTQEHDITKFLQLIPREYLDQNKVSRKELMEDNDGSWGVMAVQFIYIQQQTQTQPSHQISSQLQEEQKTQKVYKIITATKNSQVSIWDVQSGKMEKNFQLEGIIGSMKYIDGHILCGMVIASVQKPEGFLVLIDTNTGAINKYLGHTDNILEIINHNQFILTAGFDGDIKIWGFDNNQMKVFIQAPFVNQENQVSVEKQPITSMLLVPSKNMLIGGTKSGNFIMWYINFDQGDVKLFGSYKAHDGGITKMRFNYNSILSISQDQFLKVWDISFENIQKTFEHKFNSILSDFSFGKDGFGNGLIMITNLMGSVYLYNVETKSQRAQVVANYQTQTGNRCISVMSDGIVEQNQQEKGGGKLEFEKIFAVGDMRGMIHLYKFDTSSLQTQVEADNYTGNQIFA